MTSRSLIALTLMLAATGAAGCGDEEKGSPIPADQAAALQDQLDGIQRRLDNGSEGACNDILAGAKGPNNEAVEQQLGALPKDVSKDVRVALRQSFDRLFELVDERCAELGSQEPDPEPEPETTPEETTTEETTTEEEPPPTEEIPPVDPGTEELPPGQEGKDKNGKSSDGGGVVAPEGE